MANQYDMVVGLDPGVTGGITIVYKNGKVNIHRIPVKKVVVNKKTKKKYDLKEVVAILKHLDGKGVLFVQERVSSMPGEGSTSSFNFGHSAGSTEGIAHALEFDVVVVGSTKWKKYFPALINDEIRDYKAQAKELRVIGKTLKDKAAKKENKKQIDKLGRQVKTVAKRLARELVISLHPELADDFKQKNSDGMAESLLIALYGRDNQNELV
jgi:predicted RNase H-like nuclease (RuvC/YqgF family)